LTHVKAIAEGGAQIAESGSAFHLAANMSGFSSSRRTRRTALRVAVRAVLGALSVAATFSAAHAQLAPQALVGVWRGQERSPIGLMSVEVIFFANGTYARAHTAGALMTRDVGAYSVVQNWIHFQLRDYEPKYYLGRPMTRPMSDTWVITAFDGRTLQATVGGTSQIFVQRVQ